jgi:hypothetical protein
MTTHNPYLDTLTKTRETWAEVTDQLQKAITTPPTSFSDVDPSSAIDQVFDFWEKTLVAQRETAKHLVGATVAAAEEARTKVEELTATVKEQAETVQKAVADRTTKNGRTTKK